jgi:hypothetical protein
MVARAAMVLLGLAAVVAAQVPLRFTLDDVREQVRQAQGPPNLVERLYSLGIERWSWGTASVTFDPATGRVTGWHDPRRALRATLRPSQRARDSVLTLGMPLGDVARLFGTPWAITPGTARGQLLLAYGRSAVRIDHASRRVNGWMRGDGALRTAPIDDAAAHIAVGAAPPESPVPIASHASPTAGVAIVLDTIRDQDGDARLAPREFGDVTFRVRNPGRHWSPPLRAQFLHAPGLATMAGTPDTLWTAPLAPGDSVDLSVVVYTPTSVTDPELTLVVWAGTIPTRLSVRVPTAAVASASTVATGEPPIDRAPVVARNPDALAVVIGVERYLRGTAATDAARDALVMRTFVTRTLGVPDDAAHLVVRTDAAASGSELRRLLDDRGWLARRTTDNTDLILYFGGHGALGSGQVPHLLPADADPAYVDATGIDLHALFERLARWPARSITVFLDACFSGLARSGRPLVAGTRAAVVSIEHPALLRRNMAVFTASRGAQPAGTLPAAGHGAFTYFVARGLQGRADTDGDGTITVAELGRYTEDEVRTASAVIDREQEPLTIARDTARVLVRLPPRRP